MSFSNTSTTFRTSLKTLTWMSVTPRWTRTTFSSSSMASTNPISNSNSNTLPPSSIPIFTDLSSLRQWRQKAFQENKSVGFVPTMGALHEGHLSLVKESLAVNDLTIISIFVNPTQFAPHEDLASYPRTLPQDLLSLESLSSSTIIPTPTSSSKDKKIQSRTPSAVFLPSVDVMYPSSVSQVVQDQKGTFVEVKGFGDKMEGKSRPTFFRGVATVVTKLFNAIQPTHAYFGQKDIQQAILLRRMVNDLLMPYPTKDTLHIIPTSRSSIPEDGNLALSSRNAYLTPSERKFAPSLYVALQTAERAWNDGHRKADVIKAALSSLESAVEEAKKVDVQLKVDYVEINDPWTFEIVDNEKKQSGLDEVFVLSGALWVGRTRLIDNILLGDSSKILY